MRCRKPLALTLTLALVLQLFPVQAWAEVMGEANAAQPVAEEQVVGSDADQTDPQDEAPQSEAGASDAATVGEDQPTDSAETDASEPEDATPTDDSQAADSVPAEEEVEAAADDATTAPRRTEITEDDINDDSDEESILTPYAETWYYESGRREDIYLSDKSTGLTYVVNVTE